tara:strand:- start:5908 stop:6297 length:390 start_codon:yes stop_codon:yes gene_type:complete
MLRLKKKNHQRQLKISEHLKRSLSEISNNCFFENIDTPFKILITEVNVSIDLKTAYVFVLPIWLKDKKLGELEFLEVLHGETYVFKKKLGTYLSMRYTPKIVFKIDTLEKESQKIEDLFNDPKISQDLN